MNVLRLLRKLTFLSEATRLEWYPPFWLMRVKVLEISGNWQTVRLKLPLNLFSKNMGDGMYGGYQASVSDPIAALACAKRFPGHEVWARKHVVDFRFEGNSDLELRFYFDAAIEQKIKNDLANKGRSTPTFEYGLYRKDGVCCSVIHSTVAIRPRGYRAPLDTNIKNEED